ncbi:MAG TPA: hypothetical protein VGE52_18770, partial [Pirellulales bacterium]
KKQVEDRLEKYNAEFPPLPLNQWVDLAGYVDPFQHALGGFWERDGEKLVAEDGIQDCRLAVPVVPTGAYELDLGIYRGLHPIGKPRRTYSGMEQPQAPNDFQFVFPVGDRYARIAWASSGPVDYRLDGQPDYRVLLGNGSKRLRSGKSATFDEIGSRYVSCQLTVDAVSPRTEIVLWKQRERDLNWAGRLTDLPTAAGTAVEPRCFRIESPYGGAEVRSLWLRVLSGPVRLDMN